MEFRDQNGEQLRVGDEATLNGEYLSPRYLDGVNGTITGFGTELVHVEVRNQKGIPRPRTVAPENVRKGHHGIDPGESNEEFMKKAFTRFAKGHLSIVLHQAEREGVVEPEQRVALEMISAETLGIEL